MILLPFFDALFLISVVLPCHGLERSDRLLLDDPHALQSQIQHLVQELNTLKSHTNAEISSLKSQLASQKQELLSLKGSTFTIWGKNSCPNVSETQMIYNGFTAGSNYADNGNGANTLCMPHDPESALYGVSVAVSDDYAYLYGAEYRLNIGRVRSKEDVPCSVCQVKLPTTIMIPGKRSCPLHWRKQYSGILTAERFKHNDSEYLCLDDNPDAREGSGNVNNGRLFYPVKTICGSLPCPPYGHHNLVSCVVCSS